MNTLISNQDQAKVKFIGYDKACPYNGINVCMASFSSMAIDNQKRENCCGTENYDNCPIFLSKVLRRS
jgi:hypothetical protein